MKVRYLSLPPFNFKVTSNNNYFLKNLERIYSNCLSDAPILCDYHVSVIGGSGIRKFIKPQISFLFDQIEPFKPLPENHAFAMFEWGLNWVVASTALQYVFVHSAVLAKQKKAVLFPAAPGSGKSTLTSYLAQHGWQLLSDEMALVKPESTQVVPFVRPICLKNNSIDIAKQWYDSKSFSSIAKNTHKGDVAHVAAPPSSVELNTQSAEIKSLVFPKYKQDCETKIYELTQAQAFTKLTENSFNYGVIGDSAFSTMIKLVENTKSFEIEYSDLADLKDFLEEEIV